MRKAFFLICCLLGLHQAMAQDFQVPQNYTLNQASDFAKYEKDVVACVNWLEATPLDEQVAKRKEASGFLLKWLMGSPSVSIELREFVAKMGTNNPDLILLFMGGWARHVIENPSDAKDAFKGNWAGLNTALKVYKAGKGVKKDKEVDKLVKMQAKGKLEQWLKDQLKGS